MSEQKAFLEVFNKTVFSINYDSINSWLNQNLKNNLATIWPFQSTGGYFSVFQSLRKNIRYKFFFIKVYDTTVHVSRHFDIFDNSFLKKTMTMFFLTFCFRFLCSFRVRTPIYYPKKLIRPHTLSCLRHLHLNTMLIVQYTIHACTRFTSTTTYILSSAYVVYASTCLRVCPSLQAYEVIINNYWLRGNLARVNWIIYPATLTTFLGSNSIRISRSCSYGFKINGFLFS